MATSTQLEAFRRDFPLAANSRSLWLSATLNKQWLDTIDFKPQLPDLNVQTIGEQDRAQASERLHASKSLARLDASLSKDAGNKTGLGQYIEALGKVVQARHQEDDQTLVIVDNVERAQKLFTALQKLRPGHDDLLIHARFRAAERAQQVRTLRSGNHTDRIIIAAQAIEAGVDISSRVLITELAP